MSSSKAQQTSQPKCTRCRHHGVVVPQKGHMKRCPFLKCACWKCYLITQRSRIEALQRNLTRGHDKEPRSSQPAAEGSRSASAPDTSGLILPAPGPGGPGGAPQRAGSPDPGGEVLPSASSEQAASSHAPYFGGRTAPLSPIHLPSTMSALCPSSYDLYPNVPLNMPWLPPIPAGLYPNGLRGPFMFPRFPPVALHYPPPPQPGSPADSRTTPPPLPAPVQEEGTQSSWIKAPYQRI